VSPGEGHRTKERQAEARERGDHRESSWLWLYENHGADPVGTRLRALLALAFHEPRLRVLGSYTSHWTLCFSETPAVALRRR
jgi:hypothetical protein